MKYEITSLRAPYPCVSHSIKQSMLLFATKIENIVDMLKHLNKQNKVDTKRLQLGCLCAPKMSISPAPRFLKDNEEITLRVNRLSSMIFKQAYLLKSKKMTRAVKSSLFDLLFRANMYMMLYSLWTAAKCRTVFPSVSCLLIRYSTVGIPSMCLTTCTPPITAVWRAVWPLLFTMSQVPGQNLTSSSMTLTWTWPRNDAMW